MSTLRLYCYCLYNLHRKCEILNKIKERKTKKKQLPGRGLIACLFLIPCESQCIYQCSGIEARLIPCWDYLDWRQSNVCLSMCSFKEFPKHIREYFFSFRVCQLENTYTLISHLITKILFLPNYSSGLSIVFLN